MTFRIQTGQVTMPPGETAVEVNVDPLRDIAELGFSVSEYQFSATGSVGTSIAGTIKDANTLRFERLANSGDPIAAIIHWQVIEQYVPKVRELRHVG